MKKTTLTILLLFILNLGIYSQMTVTDPANTSIAKTNSIINKATLAKSVKILYEAKQQVEKAKETVSLLKKAKETIEKVSNVIKDLDEVYQIFTLQTRIINSVDKNIKRLKANNVFSSQELIIITKSLTRLVASATQSVSLLDQLLSNNLFKMKDAERLEFIQKIKNKMSDSLSDINTISRKYQSIANSRVMKRMAKQTKK